MTDDPILVTTREAAEDVGVPEWVVRAWASAGHLPPHSRRGKETVYRLDDIIKMETRHRKKVSADRLEHLLRDGNTMYKVSEVTCLAGSVHVCEPVPKGAPVQLCRLHLLEVADWVYDQRQEYKTTTRRLTQQSEHEDPQLVKHGRKDVVYFVRFGDRVKIGYSSNFRRRMSEVPYDEILLVLPGTAAHESALHEMFKTHRITGEWFTLHQDILDFITEQQAVE